MDEFRKEAKEARTRLRKGFWNDIIIERRNIIENATKNGQDIKVVNEFCKRRIINKIREMNKTNDLSEEDIMYKKVCEIMSSNEVLLNPLSKLINHDIYDKLNENAKQSYILKLSEQYVKLKERYDNEHKKEFDIAY